MKSPLAFLTPHFLAVLSVCATLERVAAATGETLFVATPLTEEGAFTEGIEDPACDAQGNVYAVNFARQQTIGKVSPDGKATVYVDGNLYITRHGKGTVVKISPQGDVLRDIDVLGPLPSNICFGDPDGRTVYVTEVKHRRLVQFRVDRPGLEWRLGQMK